MTRHQTSHHRREAVLGSRWMQAVSCYRITSVYLMVAALVILLVLVT